MILEMIRFKINFVTHISSIKKILQGKESVARGLLAPIFVIVRHQTYTCKYEWQRSAAFQTRGKFIYKWYLNLQHTYSAVKAVEYGDDFVRSMWEWQLIGLGAGFSISDPWVCLCDPNSARSINGLFFSSQTCLVGPRRPRSVILVPKSETQITNLQISDLSFSNPKSHTQTQLSYL